MRMYILPLLFLSACSGTDSKNKGGVSDNITTINLVESSSCNYSGTSDFKTAYLFKSDAEAEKAVNSIMKCSELPTNFLVVAADVDNVTAVIHSDKRYILYSQKFVEEIKRQTKSKYGFLSILSHQIGHHLYEHNFLDVAARPNLELDADRFSGFILAKMGANIEEAYIAINMYGNINGSSTHPNKRARIAAITNGWKEAIQNNQMNTNQETASSATSQGVFSIDVVGKAKYITIRNRSLSLKEYKLGNSGTQEGDMLNKETIIMNLPNGTEVEVFSSASETYYVKAQTSQGEVLGYIAKSFAGHPTIKARVKR